MCSMGKEKLSIKQERFIQEYLKTGNATQSIIKAYPDVTYDSARMMASENLAKPSIKSRIDDVLDSQGVNAAFIIRELKQSNQDARNDKQHSASIKAIKLLADFVGITNESKTVARLDSTNNQAVNLSESQALQLMAIHDAIGLEGIRQLVGIIDNSEANLGHSD